MLGLQVLQDLHGVLPALWTAPAACGSGYVTALLFGVAEAFLSTGVVESHIPNNVSLRNG